MLILCSLALLPWTCHLGLIYFGLWHILVFALMDLVVYDVWLLDLWFVVCFLGVLWRIVFGSAFWHCFCWIWFMFVDWWLLGFGNGVRFCWLCDLLGVRFISAVNLISNWRMDSIVFLLELVVLDLISCHRIWSVYAGFFFFFWHIVCCNSVHFLINEKHVWYIVPFSCLYGGCGYKNYKLYFDLCSAHILNVLHN